MVCGFRKLSTINTMGEERWRENEEEENKILIIICRFWDELNEMKKKTQEKNYFVSLPPAIFSHVLGNSSWVHTAVAQEDSLFLAKVLGLLLMSMTFHGVEYPLRLFGPGTLSVAPPHILPTLKLFAFGACWRVSLDSVPPLLRNFPNIGLIPVLFLLHYTCCCAEN